jgi:SAM-dependent methyltransferase
MKSKAVLNLTEASLRAKVNLYQKRVKEVEKYLSKNPNEWGRFQNEFNSEVNAVFRDIMNFEKANIAIGQEDKVYKLKQLFVKKIRKKIFERGDLTDWILRKPYGYAGDFKIIEDLYENNPSTTGFARLFDNYIQMTAMSVAVRNRKNDFKRFIVEFIKSKQSQPVRIMDLASGPAREVKEIFSENGGLCEHITFDCYDNDRHALEFASAVLAKYANVNFIKENATRIAFRKDVNSLIGKKYDLIYSTGLFDYFEEKLAVRLIANLKKLLNPQGVMIISDVRDKYSNPTCHFMEWVTEWELVYRDDDNFRNIFINAGFKENELVPGYEQQGILQYIKAINRQ